MARCEAQLPYVGECCVSTGDGGRALGVSSLPGSGTGTGRWEYSRPLSGKTWKFGSMLASPSDGDKSFERPLINKQAIAASLYRLYPRISSASSLASQMICDTAVRSEERTECWKQPGTRRNTNGIGTLRPIPMAVQ